MSASEFNRQLRSTLYDLISDLEKNASTKHHATAMRSALKEVKTTKLHRVLRDEESMLSKSIPMDLLKSDPSGQEYVNIIEQVRPKKKEEGEYGVLTSLAETIKNEIGDVPETMEQLTPEVFQSVIQKTMSIMDRKQKSGELDLSAIQAQAQKMMEQYKDNPEFQAAVSAISGLGNFA
jgi:hypothetical protein